MKTVHAVFLAAVAALSLATASAQPYGGPIGGCRGVGCGSGYGPGPHMGSAPGPGYGSAFGDATVVAQARLDALRSRLQLAPAQEPAWQALADAMLEQARQMDQARTRLFDSTGNAAERMTLRAELLGLQADAFAMVAHAFNGLYAVLTPEQRLVLERQWGYGMGVRFGRGP